MAVLNVGLAGLAQSVEHPTRNHKVPGLIPAQLSV